MEIKVLRILSVIELMLFLIVGFILAYIWSFSVANFIQVIIWIVYAVSFYVGILITVFMINKYEEKLKNLEKG